MENDTHGESRPPLLRRWVLLSCKSQTVKDSLCLAIFAITLQILSGQYVFMAILIALELGLLIVMDYRDWVNQQVQREATKLDPSVSVSSALLLSPQGLQDQYHNWMFKIPAVRQQPLLCGVTLLVTCVRFLVAKAEDECGWLHVAVGLPGVALAAARMALIRTPSEFQSLLSVLSWAYLLAQICVFKAFNDTCWMNVAHLPDKTSLYGYACMTMAKTVVGLCLSPCTMHHLEANLWLVGLGTGSSNYIGYLQNNGGLTFDSDLDLLGFQTVAASTALCLLAAAVFRYSLAKKHMTAFLRSISRTRRYPNERSRR